MNKKFSGVTTVAALALVSALALTACSSGTAEPEETVSAGDAELRALLPESVLESGELLVATDANYPPCDFMNEDGEIDGYNHDFLMVIADKLGITITQESIAFDGLIPGVQGGKYLAAMECISDRAERQQQVMFIDNAYATSGVLTLGTNPAGITENPLTLCGVPMAIQSGTDYVNDEVRFSENCVNEGLPAIDATEFPDATSVYTALQSGRAEAAFTNLTTGAYLDQTTDGEFIVFTSPLMAKVYNGIIVAHESTDLAAAIEGALNLAIEDGSYLEVLEKWGLEGLAMEKAGINLATSEPLETPELCGACGLE